MFVLVGELIKENISLTGWIEGYIPGLELDVVEAGKPGSGADKFTLETCLLWPVRGGGAKPAEVPPPGFGSGLKFAYEDA